MEAEPNISTNDSSESEIVSEAIQFPISVDESDRVLAQAVEEESKHLRLTPGMLRTIRRKGE